MTAVTELRELLFGRSADQIDGFLVTKAENIGYLTGFWGTFAQLVLTPQRCVLLSDARYSEKAQAICKECAIEYREWLRQKDFWKNLLRDLSISILGYEAHDLSVEKLDKYRKAMGRGVRFRQTSGLVEKLRLQKKEAEKEILRKAAHIADQTLEFVLPYLQEGVSEKEIAWLLEKTAREEFGVEGVSFPPIVAFGPGSAIPHHESSDRKLRKNTPLLIDFGVKYQKYCSDMTRSLYFGKPTEKWLQTYEILLRAQGKGLAQMKIGGKLSLPEKTARKVLGEEAAHFSHSFGHGVGLEIHEAPHLSEQAKGKFLADMVVTAEPGLYFPGEFGIRIEDLVIVDKQPEIISHFPKSIEQMILN